jgi:hypothetical protein
VRRFSGNKKLMNELVSGNSNNSWKTEIKNHTLRKKIVLVFSYIDLKRHNNSPICEQVFQNCSGMGC